MDQPSPGYAKLSHRIDENSSGEVAPLLAHLRELRRRHHLAVLVVHHAKKGGGHIRAGRALRGSSEFHAWGDSNLYLRRLENLLTLTVEHRAAPSHAPIELELVQRGESLVLEVRAAASPAREEASPLSSVDQRILSALGQSDAPVPAAELRALCSIRKATFYARLLDLTRTGRLVRSPEGYRLANTTV